jgi:hypothetical protein
MSKVLVGLVNGQLVSKVLVGLVNGELMSEVFGWLAGLLFG